MQKEFVINSTKFFISYPQKLEHLVEYFSLNYPESKKVQCYIRSNIKIAGAYDNHWIKKLSNSHYHTVNGFLYRFNNNLDIVFKESAGNDFTLDLFINEKTNLTRLIARSITGTISDFYHHLYVQALRHSILFPYFVSKIQKGCFLMHGGAFYTNDGAILIIGLDGVGKSTILNNLYNLKYEIAADNFLLCDDKNVYVVPDPLRIYPKAGSESSRKRYTKINSLNEKIRIKKVVFTILGVQYSFKKSTSEWLINKFGNAINSLNEFIDFNKFVSTLKLLNENLNVKKNISFDKDIKFYFCERANHDDNMRMIDEIL